MQQRAELGAAAGLVVDAEGVGDLQGELDDVLRVVARVLVVGLDHVAEQQRGAAVGLRELERAVDARLALAGEEGEERDEREDEEDRVGLAGGAERGEQADRGEQRVDAIDEREVVRPWRRGGRRARAARAPS